MAIIIEPAQFPDDADTVLSLFSAYAVSLGIDLTFQDFQQELDSLPGKYAAPNGGTILIARSDTNHQTQSTVSSRLSTPLTPHTSSLGCVALRSSSDGWCEMKRLYVVKEVRRERLGEKLVQAILEQAKSIGYRGIRLDTLPQMTAAIKLYRKYGFVEIGPYYDTPLQGTIFMGCDFSRV